MAATETAIPMSSDEIRDLVSISKIISHTLYLKPAQNSQTHIFMNFLYIFYPSLIRAAIVSSLGDGAKSVTGEAEYERDRTFKTLF